MDGGVRSDCRKAAVTAYLAAAKVINAGIKKLDKKYANFASVKGRPNVLRADYPYSSSWLPFRSASA
jgi:hypothetical protein